MDVPDRAIRVAFATPGGLEHGGGIGRMAGYAVDRFAASGAGPDCSVLDTRGGGSVWLSPFYLAPTLGRLALALLRRKVDLVHINVSERGSFLRKAAVQAVARLFGCPTLVHLHGATFVEFFDSGRWARGISRLVFGKADAVVVLGAGWRDVMVQRVGIPAGKVHVLYNGVPDIGRDGAERSAPDGSAPLKLLVLANLSERKGIGCLLQAARLLQSRGVAFDLTIGGGGDVDGYRRRAAELGIAERCRFLGWVGQEQAHALVHASDALLLPSTHEGLPMVILEALSARLPVITTPVGSIPEVLDDGDTALLVRVNDPENLADAIQRLGGDPALWRRLADNGRALYERLFAIDAHCARLAAIYQRVCRDRVSQAAIKSSTGDTPMAQTTSGPGNHKV